MWECWGLPGVGIWTQYLHCVRSYPVRFSVSDAYPIARLFADAVAKPRRGLVVVVGVRRSSYSVCELVAGVPCCQGTRAVSRPGRWLGRSLCRGGYRHNRHIPLYVTVTGPS